MKQRRLRREGGRPLSVAEVEDELLRTVDLMELYTNGGIDPDDGDIVGSLASLVQARADSDRAHKAAEASAALRAAGRNREARQANVVNNARVRELKEKADFADVLYGARKAQLDLLRHTMDALRTISANVRSQT